MAWIITQHDGTPRGHRVGAPFDTRIDALVAAEAIDAHRTREQIEAHPLSVERVTPGPGDAALSEEQAQCAETERDMGHDAEGWRF